MPSKIDPTQLRMPKSTRVDLLESSSLASSVYEKHCSHCVSKKCGVKLFTIISLTFKASQTGFESMHKPSFKILLLLETARN